MINETPLQTIDKSICDLINSHDGLWREIAQLSMTMEYVLIEDPFKKLLCQLDAIEISIGETDITKELRYLLCSQSPALDPRPVSLSYARCQA